MATEAASRFTQSHIEEKEQLSVEDQPSQSGQPVQWLCALSKTELLPESDSALLWLCRFPIENNHPRPLTGRITSHIAAGEVLTVHEGEKLPKVFNKLVTEGFLGCPVLDSSHRFLYFIDMLDLVWFVCDMFHAWSNDVYYVPSEPRLKQDWATFFQLEGFKNASVRDVVNKVNSFSFRAPCSLSHKGFSTFSAIEQMARLGQHRVAVLNQEKKVAGLVTQSMIISLLDQNIDKLGRFGTTAVRDMVAGLSGPLKTVPEQTFALDAFKLMSLNRYSGLAVVNAEGILVDSISVRDLRGIGTKAEHFERLWHSVKAFKEEVRKEFPTQTPPQPITVTLDDTLETVIKSMDDGNIHRIYVVEMTADRKCRPLHVITQRDVLKFLMFRCGLEPVWERQL